MNSYTIFLGIVQVVILSSMFYIAKNYGKKALIKFAFILIAIVLFIALIVSQGNKSSSKPSHTLTKKEIIPKQKDENITYPKDKHICELGMEFYENKEYQKAYAVFQKGYEQKDYCSTMWYGTTYYNGIYIKQDREKGGKIWLEAYDMAYDKFDADINYNLGIYYDYVLHNREKSRYHLAIAVKSGDKDALRILRSTSILKDFEVSYLFFDETVRFDLKEIDYDVIQKRFVYFENQDKSWKYNYYFEPYRYDEFKNKSSKIIIAKKFIEVSSNTRQELEKVVKKLLDVIYIDKHKSIYKTDDFIITKSKDAKSNLFKIKLDINYKKSKYPPIIGKLHTNSDTDICENQDFSKILDGSIIPRYCNRKTQKPITGTYINNYFGYRDIQQEIKDGYADGIEYQFDKNGKIQSQTNYKKGVKVDVKSITKIVIKNI